MTYFHIVVLLILLTFLTSTWGQFGIADGVSGLFETFEKVTDIFWLQ